MIWMNERALRVCIVNVLSNLIVEYREVCKVAPVPLSGALYV